jgi:hypothetical protein
MLNYPRVYPQFLVGEKFPGFWPTSFPGEYSLPTMQLRHTELLPRRAQLEGSWIPQAVTAMRELSISRNLKIFAIVFSKGDIHVLIHIYIYIDICIYIYMYIYMAHINI